MEQPRTKIFHASNEPHPFSTDYWRD